MPLTDTSVRNAKPDPAKDYKLFDGHGLYLLVKKNGAKYWRFKYRFAGREKKLAIGVYPDVSLKRARELHAEARQRLRDGEDPQAIKAARKASDALTFQTIYADWLKSWTAKGKGKPKENRSIVKAEWLYRCHLAPHFDSLPIDRITDVAIIKVMVDLERDGKLETAHRVYGRMNQIMRFAKARKLIAHNPCADIEKADVIAPIEHKHHAALTDPKEVGALLRAIDGYNGQPTTRAALKLAPMLFVRPIELRAALWAEIDLDRAEWRIGADRMKMDEKHIVPLPRQAVAILREIEPFTKGTSKYVFPALNNPNRPLSENTLNGALRRLGYAHDEQVSHGFRALASTLLNELDVNPDHIELQLAHKPTGRQKVRKIYDRSIRLSARRQMMQEWADYLDQLKGAKPQESSAA